MKQQKFYHLAQKLTLTTIVVYDVLNLSSSDLDKAIEENKLNYPLVFKQQKEGKKWADILDRRTISNFQVISEKFADLIRENKFTGVKFVPIKIIGLAGQEVQGYTGLFVTGKCSPLNYDKSEPFEKDVLIATGETKPMKYYRGVEVVDWDGSDFFMPPDSKHIIVTQEVKEVVEKARLSNIRIEGLDIYELSELNYRYIMDKRNN